MKLNLDILPSGRTELEVEQSIIVPADNGEESLNECLAGVLTVDNTDRHVILSGDLEARGESICDRCLERFELVFSVPVDITIVRDRYRHEIEETDEFDSWVLHQAQGEVDLDDPLREAAVLAQPQKMICNKDCRGLCPSCGVNLNRESCDCTAEDHDPRWDGLPD